MSSLAAGGRRPGSLAALLTTLAALVALPPLGGCGEATSPPRGEEPIDTSSDPAFDGAVDPSAGAYDLQRTSVEGPDGRPIPVTLVGMGIEVDREEEIVSIGVAVRNDWRQPLFAPATILVRAIHPRDVRILNADEVVPPRPDTTGTPPPDTTGVGPRGDDPPGTPARRYLFDYSDAIGGGVLEPGETSAPRVWRFHVPGLDPFTFVAMARFHLEPPHDGAVIGGRVFVDANRNGTFDSGDHGFPGAIVIAFGSDDFVLTGETGRMGTYAIPIDRSGLYTVDFELPIDAAGQANVPICPTTPRPVRVVIPPDGDGAPAGSARVSFGFTLGGPCVEPPPPPPPAPRPVPLELTSHPLEGFGNDRYELIGLELHGHVLRVKVGFSGCSPDHPFRLVASTAFAESLPVQTRAVLLHDGRGELCAAHFTRELAFDVTPLLRHYVKVYGEPGAVIMNLADYEGDVHPILVQP